MRKILIPTDFSADADNALDFALHLFKEENAQIFLLHTTELPSTGTTVIMDLTQILKENALEDLNELIIKKKQENSIKHTIVPLFEYGPAAYLIDKVAKENGCQLIIMGNKKKDFIKKLILGSTTISLLKKTEVPVLVIPENCNPRTFENVGVACEVVEKLEVESSEIQKLFDQKLEINYFHVETKPIDFEIEAVMNLPEIEIIFRENVQEGIDYMITHKKIDLVVMLKKEQSFLERFLNSSKTTENIENSFVPCLILHK